MHEIAGLQLAKLRVKNSSIEKMEQLRAACLEFYQAKFPYAPGSSNSFAVVKHLRLLDFCTFYQNKKSASTLLANLLICLPPDSELFHLVNVDQIISKIKLNLGRYGYTETTFATENLRERVDIINDLIPKLCIAQDWRGTVEKVRNILMAINLALIDYNMIQIANIHFGRKLTTHDPMRPYLYALMLIELLNIAIYLAPTDGFISPHSGLRMYLQRSIDILLQHLREFDPKIKQSAGEKIAALFFSSCCIADQQVLEPEPLSRQHPKFQVIR